MDAGNSSAISGSLIPKYTDTKSYQTIQQKQPDSQLQHSSFSHDFT